MRWIASVAAVFGLAIIAPIAAADPSFTRTDIPMFLAGSPSGPESIGVANMDGVRGPDLVIGLAPLPATGSVTSQVGVLLNNGDGTFAPMTRYPTCDNAGYLQLADLSLAGKMDVVEGCFGSGHFAKLTGDGLGGLATFQLVSFGANGPVIPAVLTPGSAPALVFPSFPDFPAHHQHICFASPNDTTVTAPVCDNPGPYQPPAFMGERPLAVAAFFTPGYDAIVTPSASNPNGITTFARNPATAYQSWADDDDDAGGFAGCTSGTCVRSLLAADVTGDGSPDIVVGHGDSTHGSLSALIQNATGIPDTPSTTFPTTTDPQALAVGDFEHDGHLDIVAASGYGTVAFHHGNGDGTFGPPQPIPLLGYGNPAYATTVTMKVADFNGDGLPDIAVADYYSHTVQILLNTTPVPAGSLGGGGVGGGGIGGGVGAGSGTPGLPGSPKVLPPLLSGLKGLTSAASANSAGTITVGSASNPPIASTTQSLIYQLAGAARKRQHKRAVVVALGSTKIPSGASRSVTLKLTAAGRALLRHNKRLRTTLKLTARGADGKSASKTFGVTLKPARSLKR